jgi:hypothetical protein
MRTRRMRRREAERRGILDIEEQDEDTGVMSWGWLGANARNTRGYAMYVAKRERCLEFFSSEKMQCSDQVFLDDRKGCHIISSRWWSLSIRMSRFCGKVLGGRHVIFVAAAEHKRLY